MAALGTAKGPVALLSPLRTTGSLTRIKRTLSPSVGPLPRLSTGTIALSRSTRRLSPAFAPAVGSLAVKSASVLPSADATTIYPVRP